MKLGCITKSIVTVIFIVGVGYYVLNKYVIKNFSADDLKQKLIVEFIDSNFSSSYKDSINSYLIKKIDENKIDFSFLKEYALTINDFKNLSDKEKFHQLKKLLEKDGTQN